ncbi:MAG: hypothetical protein [Olavius algarvensis Delta 4 endosymbiont]|nr:MAG: hypothetical protein [Olavius algarvensis Delta 4 endosymbiont]
MILNQNPFFEIGSSALNQNSPFVDDHQAVFRHAFLKAF